MNIHIIRHGRTEANVKRLYCGATDEPLSDEGRRLIAKDLAVISYPKGQKFFCSTLSRAKETLKLIYGEQDAVYIHGLSEFNFGDFEMKTYEELKDLAAYQAWVADDTGAAPCPNGESSRDFKTRVQAGFKQILNDTPAHVQDVVLVTHGGVIVDLMTHFFPEEKGFYEWQPDNGRGYTVVVEDGIVRRYAPIGL